MVGLIYTGFNGGVDCLLSLVRLVHPAIKNKNKTQKNRITEISFKCSKKETTISDLHLNDLL